MNIWFRTLFASSQMQMATSVSQHSACQNWLAGWSVSWQRLNYLLNEGDISKNKLYAYIIARCLIKRYPIQVKWIQAIKHLNGWKGSYTLHTQWYNTITILLAGLYVATRLKIGWKFVNTSATWFLSNSFVVLPTLVRHKQTVNDIDNVIPTLF